MAGGIQALQDEERRKKVASLREDAATSLAEPEVVQPQIPSFDSSEVLSQPVAPSPIARPAIPNLGGQPPQPAPELSLTDRRVLGNEILAAQDTPIEDLMAAGGNVYDILGAQAAQNPVLRTALWITNTFLAKQTGEQRQMKELTGLQKVGLVISDIIAFSNGNTMPSLLLKSQGFNARTAQERVNIERAFKGQKMLFDGLGAMERVPKEQRALLALTMQPQFDAIYPGLGLAWTVLNNTDTEREAYTSAIKDAKGWGESDTWNDVNMALLAYESVYPEQGAKERIRVLESGLAGKTARYLAPSRVEASLPDWVATARLVGGKTAETANKVASGQKVSAGEIIAANRTLPVGKEWDDTIVRAFSEAPEIMLGQIPGILLTDVEIKRLEGLDVAERSEPGLFVLPTFNADGSPQLRSAPKSSREALRMMHEGAVIWNTAALTDVESLTNRNPDVLTPANLTLVQKNAVEMSDARSMMIDVEQHMDRSLLTVPARIKNAYLGSREKWNGFLGADLSNSPEDAKWRDEFLTVRQTAFTALNEMMHAMSGAAVSPAEAERLKEGMPDPVNDDPAAFELKMNNKLKEFNVEAAKFNAWGFAGYGARNRVNMTRYKVQNDMKQAMLLRARDYRASPAHSQLTDQEVSDLVVADIEELYGILPGWMERSFPLVMKNPGAPQ